MALREEEFEAALKRIHDVAGTRTQVGLAKILGIRQSSISDAKRRKNIPGDWLIKLISEFSVNPFWVLNGEGGRYLIPSSDKETSEPILRYTGWEEADKESLKKIVRSRLSFSDLLDLLQDQVGEGRKVKFEILED